MIGRRTFLGVVGAGMVSPRLLSALSASSALRASSVYVERWSWAMGQPVSLKLFASSEAEGYDAAQAAFAELRRIEAKLSRFDPTSDLTALNERAGGSPILVDPELARVLRIAEGVRGATGGAFDPAIEPVMRAWGFHAERSTAPSAPELAEARAAVRAAKLRWDGGRVALDGSGAALDLGGIGVGYGLDRAGAVLRARGIGSALLDVSGDLLAIGAPPGERGWEVGIADPSATGGAPVRTVHLHDRALATSANTESVVRWNGKAFGHVMDPHTAAPAARVRQVTVVAPSGVLADAWSTAAFVGTVPPPRGCELFAV
ncbi:MAG TPA: FAD:protein FMN transferase [Gemmatimonadales bacterium]